MFIEKKVSREFLTTNQVIKQYEFEGEKILCVHKLFYSLN